MVWQVENAKRFCSFSLTLGKPGKHFCSALPEMFSGVYGKRHSRALQLASERECGVFQNILWLESIYILIQGWRSKKKEQKSSLFKKQCNGNIRTHKSFLLRYKPLFLKDAFDLKTFFKSVLLCRLCHSAKNNPQTKFTQPKSF